MSSSRQSRSAAPTAAQKQRSAERTAAARGRIAAAQRRRQIWMVVGSVGLVAVIVVALIIVKVVTDAGAPKSGQVATRANISVSSAIANVPAAAFDGVHDSSAAAPKAINGELLRSSGGKPRVLFIGGEFCPYCAAERWPLAVALARFGTLHHLGQTRSSPNDVYPNTATLSFHGATYTSNYLAFTGKEAQSNRVQGRTYAPLDPIDPADQQLWKDVGQDGYPFLDIGGRYVSLQASYDPQTLHGLTQKQIAADLSDPKSSVGRAVLGSANQLTAAICTLTEDKPAAVCESAGVRSAAAGLSGGS